MQIINKKYLLKQIIKKNIFIFLNPNIMINMSSCRVSPIGFSSSTRKPITTGSCRQACANLYLNHVHRSANDVREREEKMAEPCRRSDNANLNEQHNLAGTVFRRDDTKRVSCSRSSSRSILKQLTTMYDDVEIL